MDSGHKCGSSMWRQPANNMMIDDMAATEIQIMKQDKYGNCSSELQDRYCSMYVVVGPG